MNPTEPPLQKHAEPVINLQNPKAKQRAILSRQALSEACRRANFQIVDHDHGASGGVTERQKQSMLALGRIWRTIDQGKTRPAKLAENVAPIFEVE